MTITKSQTQIEAVLSDTDWQAFQFLAGELAGEAEASWEARLADGDVEACEAVARMVELVQAVNRPSQGFATTSRQPARHGQLGVLAAVSACLLLSLGLLWQGAGQESRIAVTVPDAGRLIAAWSDAEVPVEDAEDPEDPEMASLVDEELDVPDWLIVAVSLQPEEDGE
mgnify:CR=1 FL=1